VQSEGWFPQLRESAWKVVLSRLQDEQRSGQDLRHESCSVKHVFDELLLVYLHVALGLASQMIVGN
jgi:hypothetical protein